MATQTLGSQAADPGVGAPVGAFLCMLMSLSGCGVAFPSAEDSGRTIFTKQRARPTFSSPVVPGEALTPEDAARSALVKYFDYLYTGEYTAAVDLYAGSYERLRDQNPEIDPGDRAGLLRAVCERDGALCYRIASAELRGGPLSPEGEYRFAVEFQVAEGAIFSREPCPLAEDDRAGHRGTFFFRVRHVAEYLYQVIDPPICPRCES